MSVIVPVYNDPAGISTTLDSLLTQSTEHDFHVLVVDNASTDRTPDVVRSYDDDRITLLHETDIQSSYAARNTGIRNAETNILAFLDADMTVSDSWLENALDTFHATDADYLACDVELTLPETPSLAARYDRHTGFPVEQYLERQHFAPTCCLFVRREVFRDVGLFDPRLASGGDKEFGNRVHDAGYRMEFADDATVFHPTRNTLRSLVKKDVRVGRGLAQLQRLYPDRYGRPGIPPRPSGIKRPDRDLPTRDRLAFGALSRFLTAARASGYARELARPTDTGADPALNGPPRL
ncbi:glycosyl transferase family 2 [Halalkaliarchaeum desulfuricum]|uniref:Glycosyl transferase family 2 n=1 Tax=Halalkaliarchaeum desulfuricum TaxID=2055893 RepID=A0A343TN55_9EURY|nr:glycosyl transferase family 2 [Halalkaliarchaeum desulfuricum]